MTRSEAKPPTRSGSAEAIAGQLSGVKAALGLFGLALYALLRIAYDRFYAPFGLSADDLGLGYLELLAQAAIGAVLLVLIHGVLIWLMIAIFVEFAASAARDARAAIQRRRSGERKPDEPASKADLAWLLGIVGGGALLWLLDELTGAPVLRYGAIATFVAAAVGYNAVMMARGTSRIWRGATSEPSTPAARRWRAAFVTTVIVVGLLAALTLILGADGDARAVRDGQSVHTEFLGIPISSWGAEAATISWTTATVDPALAPLAETCLMYLGQSDGTVFLYAPHALRRATFRVPAALAAVRIVPDARCERGSPIPARGPRRP